MMVGQYHQPMFCNNGHPCCTACCSRVSRCPSCRSSGGWSRCLPMERLGSWVLQRGLVTEPSPPLALPTVSVWGGVPHTVPRGTMNRINFNQGRRASSDARLLFYNSDEIPVRSWNRRISYSSPLSTEEDNIEV